MLFKDPLKAKKFPGQPGPQPDQTTKDVRKTYKTGGASSGQPLGTRTWRDNCQQNRPH